MPRRRAPPRLYLDSKRGQWIIRDGSNFIRTGCAEPDRRDAEKRLAAYLGQKHQPERGPAPLIADILLTYSREHLPHIASARKIAYNVDLLAAWWGDKRLSEVTAANCRSYAIAKGNNGGARSDLEVLRAAIRHWHRNYGPIAVPAVIMPPKGPPRPRWLTRSEAARLLWAARHSQHLARFILLGLYTGSRPGVLLAMRWEQIDLVQGVMFRRPFGEAQDSRKRAPPVRLGKRILSHLRRWRRDGAAYLCHYNGRQIGRLYRSWDDARLAAELDGDVTPHTLRHTRATWLMQAGVDLWEAAGSLGMTTTILQQVYGHHHPDFQRRAAAI